MSRFARDVTTFYGPEIRLAVQLYRAIKVPMFHSGKIILHFRTVVLNCRTFMSYEFFNDPSFIKLFSFMTLIHVSNSCNKLDLLLRCR